MRPGLIGSDTGATGTAAGLAVERCTGAAVGRGAVGRGAECSWFAAAGEGGAAEVRAACGRPGDAVCRWTASAALGASAERPGVGGRGAARGFRGAS
ncbi:hypothetical protein ACFWXK_27105 [Streptomyces sp. NPDC059070]